jgi:hypothetical protein
MSKITLNLILRVQTDLKEGINWVKRVVKGGIKFEFQKAIGIITNEFSIKMLRN